MTITGTTKRIERIKADVPDDGVHVTGKDGTIKGTRSLYINDRLVPHGQVGFYWRKGDYGYKIYWSFAHLGACSKRVVKRTFKYMQKLHEKGLCPKAYKIKHIELILDGKTRWAYGIKMDHVHYPEEAWAKFAQGHPYDWNCLDPIEHPLHNPAGYNKFVEQLSRRFKIGDVVYCTKTKRWYQVDCDER